MAHARSMAHNSNVCEIGGLLALVCISIWTGVNRVLVMHVMLTKGS